MLSVLRHAAAVYSVHNRSKIFSTNCKRNFKVTVIGAAGGIGQPLSLLLKMNPLVTHLSMYDLAKFTHGVAVDVSHMDRCGNVSGHLGPDDLGGALLGSSLVIVPAGMPRKPGMSRDDLFNTNASIIRDVACGVARYSPAAVLAIITNPVNSMVPVASEVLMCCGRYDPRRVLGVTTLDIVRAKRFIAEVTGVDPCVVSVPVIGGHSGVTIIPVLSQAFPRLLLPQGDVIKLTKRIQEAGTEVVNAKAGSGSATLSMAYAAAYFADVVLRGLTGEPHVTACVYMGSCVTAAPYFANLCTFGRCGVEMNLGCGVLNDYERTLLCNAMPELLQNIKDGQQFIRCPTKPSTK